MLARTYYAGDAIAWTHDEVPKGTQSLATWFRSSAAGAGFSVSAALEDAVWSSTVSAPQSSSMPPGHWAYQTIADTTKGPVTIQVGRIEILPSLAFDGVPAPVDPRSQAERDLEEVEIAIRTLSAGAQSYTIGTASGGRTFTRPQLSQLIGWRDRLVATVAAERRAAGEGRASRRILVRFD